MPVCADQVGESRLDTGLRIVPVLRLSLSPMHVLSRSKAKSHRTPHFNDGTSGNRFISSTPHNISTFIQFLDTRKSHSVQAQKCNLGAIRQGTPTSRYVAEGPSPLKATPQFGHMAPSKRIAIIVQPPS